MISPELISRHPFFSSLDLGQYEVLAESGEGLTVETGMYVFHEGNKLQYFYLVVEGAVGIVQEKSGKPDTVISAVGPGHIFAWSALVSPYAATASAKALTPCWLIGFNREKIMRAFQDDCQLAYRIMEKVVQISRDRLLDARIESLVFKT